MKSYCIKEAAKLMDIQPYYEYDIKKSKYTLLIDWLLSCGFVYYGKHILSNNNREVYILTDNFKRAYPNEAKLYFEERWVEGKYYQLRITEAGIENLFDFVLKILEKELFK